MNAEQLSHEIIRLVYHQAAISPDPYVQETAVQTDIQDLLEEFAGDSVDDSILQTELGEERADGRRLRLQLEEAEAEIASLTTKLENAFNMIAV